MLQPVIGTMTKLDLSINLPDRLAQEAREAGLLAPDALAEMLADGVRKKAAERIRAARAAAGQDKAPSLASLQAIVNEVRAAKS
jgi:hypothetical protein